MKNQKSVVEVVVFNSNPDYSKAEVRTALKSLNDVLKLYYGFIERTTASNAAGKFIDIVHWADMKSAKDAAADIIKNPLAAKAFTVIKPESVQMYHFDTFNYFEE
ncbi:hypothetical protein [Aquimarina sp. 2201CG5-10]|uniref:hypothetical protein n=1 Tax=Aquimarina callyspongiae TaxID=3098150 RepID=UPI002AB3AD9C|nr:hypothetical protein [Aquimarina sp. 2201CG5-10]MDY8136120.1 hypothetical protein [Aquimarina sp. 2201CG5-10]